MMLELYDGENYESWWDAEKNGAIYDCELKGEEVSMDDIESIIHVTAVCIRNTNNIKRSNIKWRIKE